LTYFLKISKSDRKVKNYNLNYTNLSEFANNTNKNKIQNAKIKIQNYNLKLKINKIQTPVIAIYPGASGRSNFFE